MEIKLQFTKKIALFGLLLVYELKAEDSIIVKTKLGRIKGSLMQTRLGKTIYAFRGIRYAEPPVGSLRFQPSVPVKSWSNVYDASKEGPACPEPKGVLMSEDCLTLNIYTNYLPQNYTKPNKKLPVIAYIHFGGYFKGSSQSFLVGPRYLLDEDIILVTFNHRLGTLGFINTGEHHAYGNLGFKDQVLALRFIQDNIRAFGGDPNSVTLTGQSSGSRSIVLHMVSPMSKGLFHRAIAMSGSSTTPIPPQKEQVNLAVKQAKFFNCTAETFDEMFDCFMKEPYDAYAKTVPMFMEFFQSFPITIWYPSIEPKILGNDRFLSDEPEKLIKQGKIYNPVPLIIGVTRDEFGYLAYPDNGMDILYEELNEKWHELVPICFQYERNSARSKLISDTLKKYYFSNESITRDNAHTLSNLFADALVHYPVQRAANLLSNYSSAPVYFYEFAYKGRYSRHVWKDTRKPKGGVAHGDDLLYLFDTRYDTGSGLRMPFFEENDPEIFMVERLTKLWAHFARTSEPLPNEPNLFGNVNWEAYNLGTKKYLEMNKNFTLKTRYLENQMQLWNDLFPAPYSV